MWWRQEQKSFEFLPLFFIFQLENHIHFPEKFEYFIKKRNSDTKIHLFLYLELEAIQHDSLIILYIICVCRHQKN